MDANNVTIGLEVVRSKGDYVVGRVGKIIAIDNEKNRAQVSWGSWVSFSVIEPTSIPYRIDEKSYKFPKYFRL